MMIRKGQIIGVDSRKDAQIKNVVAKQNKTRQDHEFSFVVMPFCPNNLAC